MTNPSRIEDTGARFYLTVPFCTLLGLFFFHVSHTMRHWKDIARELAEGTSEEGVSELSAELNSALEQLPNNRLSDDPPIAPALIR
jgi:hypothetical protein